MAHWAASLHRLHDHVVNARVSDWAGSGELLLDGVLALRENRRKGGIKRENAGNGVERRGRLNANGEKPLGCPSVEFGLVLVGRYTMPRIPTTGDLGVHEKREILRTWIQSNKGRAAPLRGLR